MTTPALAAYLDAVQARCDAATRGPWLLLDGWHPDDTAFVVNARTDVPRLVQSVRELGEALKHIQHHCAIATPHSAIYVLAEDALARAAALTPEEPER